jgi:hypothetical protein
MLLFMGDIEFSWIYLLIVAGVLVVVFCFWRWLLGRIATSKRGQAIVAGIITFLMLPALYYVLYFALSFFVFNFLNRSETIR